MIHSGGQLKHITNWCRFRTCTTFAIKRKIRREEEIAERTSNFNESFELDARRACIKSDKVARCDHKGKRYFVGSAPTYGTYTGSRFHHVFGSAACSFQVSEDRAGPWKRDKRWMMGKKDARETAS